MVVEKETENNNVKFQSLFSNLIDELIPPVDKKFNYKLIVKNELTKSGDLELPSLSVDNLELIAKTVGIVLLTELSNKNFNHIDILKDPKTFLLYERFNYDDLKMFDLRLYKVSLYVGNGYILTVFDFDENNLLYKPSKEDPFKYIIHTYQATNFAFLQSKLLYFTKLSDGITNSSLNVMIYSPVRTGLLPYARYMLTKYGKCDAEEFYKYNRKRKFKE